MAADPEHPSPGPTGTAGEPTPRKTISRATQQAAAAAGAAPGDGPQPKLICPECYAEKPCAKCVALGAAPIQYEELDAEGHAALGRAVAAHTRPAGAAPASPAVREAATDAIHDALHKMREPCTPNDRADARRLLFKALAALAAEGEPRNG